MEMRICGSKSDLDKHLAPETHSEFLQSWDWGEFQRAVGREVLRLQWDGGQAQVIIHKLPLGLKYGYVPRLKIEDSRFKILIDYLVKFGFVFVRIESTQNLQPTTYNLQPIPNRQPQHTLVIDLSKSDEQLQTEMHSKTRYNVHLAEKKGVVVKEEKNIDIFWKLNTETSARDKFKSHDKSYYEKMLASPLTHQLIAYLDDRPIASNILICFGDTFTYLHGASGNADRNFMAPYLLQWEGMKLAKALGCRYYDMWGVAPSYQPASSAGGLQATSYKLSCFNGYCWEVTHPWTGVTRFKAGFGGEARSYPQAVDVVFQSMKYKLYQLARKFEQ